MEPYRAARQALIYAFAAVAIGFVWIWHGVVPKLAGPHPDEIAMLIEAGIAEPWAPQVTQVIGAAELLFGLAFLPLAGRRTDTWKGPTALVASSNRVV